MERAPLFLIYTSTNSISMQKILIYRISNLQVATKKATKTEEDDDDEEGDDDVRFYIVFFSIFQHFGC